MPDHLMLLWTVTLVCLTMAALVDGFELTILHTGYVHSRVAQMSLYSHKCSILDRKAGVCYGGVPRLKAKADELRKMYPNSVLLDSGGWYQGSLFFSAYGGQVLSDFMNLVGYDAMALDIHEFDLGPEGLEPFLQNATFPVLSSNIDLSDLPKLLSSVKRAVLMNVSGEKIGIVGFTPVSVLHVSKPEPVQFDDEVASIQKEVDKLVDAGVNKIIALGGGGADTYRKVAVGVRGVDMVVGGDSDRLMYTGDSLIEVPDEPYPRVVRNKEGRDVLIVQGHIFGIYLGFLQVKFDGNGVIEKWSGNPILMDKTVEQDKKALALLAKYRPGTFNMKITKVGVSYVHLVGKEVCYLGECNMGNLIADAFLYQATRRQEGKAWSGVSLALFNSGGIKMPITKGDISAYDCYAVFSFENSAILGKLNGKDLLDAFEHSAAGNVTKGEFLQMSGARVVYNMQEEVGNRVVDLQIMCNDCEVPKFEPLYMEKIYPVVLPSYLVDGGDGYTMIKNNIMEPRNLGIADYQLLADYIKAKSPITNGLDGRIQFQHKVLKLKMCGEASETRSFLRLIIAMNVVVTLL